MLVNFYGTKGMAPLRSYKPSRMPYDIAMTSVTMGAIEPRPVAVGSRMRFAARFMGRLLVYTYRVEELVPNKRLVMRTDEGPFPMETTYSWTDAGPDATRMTLRNRGEPAGFAKVGTPLMEAAMRRANRKDLVQLKRILESRG